MKTKLYLEIVGSLDVKAFTNEKQTTYGLNVCRVVLLDKKEVDKILDIREKWAALQLSLSELWKKANSIDGKEIKTVEIKELVEEE